MAAACVHGGGILVSAVDEAEAEMSKSLPTAIRRAHKRAARKQARQRRGKAHGLGPNGVEYYIDEGGPILSAGYVESAPIDDPCPKCRAEKRSLHAILGITNGVFTFLPHKTSMGAWVAMVKGHKDAPDSSAAPVRFDEECGSWRYL